MTSATEPKTSDLTHSSALEDQAATAALYVVNHQHESNVVKFHDDNPDQRFLDANNKLSSAGAAASLKYAKPQDLPSFPSVGLSGRSNAGQAASIGWNQSKSPEYWRPDGVDPAASKAAMLAKDYKAAPLWQPEQSANGAKAALLAAKDGGRVEIWQPEPTAEGSSAATQAMKLDRNGGLSPQLDYGYTAIGRQGSKLAATGAMSGSRKRADSIPVSKTPLYPDEANAATNALSAAAHANDPARRSKQDISAIGGASPITNMPVAMYTSNPPVAPEVEEKRRADMLHASAVAMAKSMYNVQQKQIDAAKNVQRGDSRYAASSAHGRSSMSSEGDEAAPMKFNNLQEAAQKLAQERLAKLYNEDAQNRDYRDYYSGTIPPKVVKSTSTRMRPHQRATSVDSLDDQEQSDKIRAQMSLFSSNLSQVDQKKRQADQAALMAAAQRNVTAKLNGMDERNFRASGKLPSSTLSDYQVRAQAVAQKNSEGRMENHGRINIGGGVFVNQSEVDLVARRNVQPVLDEINEKAEAQRLRELQIKLEQDERRRVAETQRTRELEVKEINRQLAQQDKAQKAEEKRLEKERERALKEDMKKAAREQKEAARAQKEEQRKSATTTKTVAVVPVTVEHEVRTEDVAQTDDAGDAAADEEDVEADEEDVEDKTEEAVEPEEKVVEAKHVSEPAPKIEPIEEVLASDEMRDADRKHRQPMVPLEEVLASDEMRDADRRETPAATAHAHRSQNILQTEMEQGQQTRLDEVIDAGHAQDGKTKKDNWFKRLTSRRKSDAGKFQANRTTVGSKVANTKQEDKTTTTAVVAGTQPDKSGADDSTVADGHDVAMTVPETEQRGRSTEARAVPDSPVSALSPVAHNEDEDEAEESEEEFEEARDNFEESLAPAPAFPAEKSTSPNRQSKFTEVV